MRVLGAVTEDSNDVVSSVSGERMGDRPGKGGTTDLLGLAEITGDEGVGEGLNMDAGSSVSLATIIVDIDGVLCMSVGALVVGGRLVARDTRNFYD
jgi:hypothetical protein